MAEQSGGGGYDIGASLSGSASSGASQSGALDASSGGRFGSMTYGPGSVITELMNGSGSAGGVSIGWPVILLVAAAVVAGVWILKK